MDRDQLYALVDFALQELIGLELIHVDVMSALEATILGQAIVASALSPEDGTFVPRELKKAVQAFLMDGEMHVLYTFTPVQLMQTEINWQIFRKGIESLDERGLRVLTLIGIKPAFVNKM
jgi:DNA polymerase theta